MILHKIFRPIHRLNRNNWVANYFGQQTKTIRCVISMCLSRWSDCAMRSASLSAILRNGNLCDFPVFIVMWKCEEPKSGIFPFSFSSFKFLHLFDEIQSNVLTHCLTICLFTFLISHKRSDREKKNEIHSNPIRGNHHHSPRFVVNTAQKIE